jgi:hypothetical protein
VNWDIWLLQESADLLLDLLVRFRPFLEEAYPGEQHMHLSVTGL